MEKRNKIKVSKDHFCHLVHGDTALSKLCKDKVTRPTWKDLSKVLVLHLARVFGVTV